MKIDLSRLRISFKKFSEEQEGVIVEYNESDFGDSLLTEEYPNSFSCAMAIKPDMPVKLFLDKYLPPALSEISKALGEL